jgi:serine/threonine protein phosphatase PrpC
MRAAAKSHPGRQRTVNEDRCHADPARGMFLVVDGVGGQAAGGKAADVAISMMRTRLERETGPIPGRIREALTIANNEIHRLAATRPEWHGMACVATVAVVDGSHVIVGHVGDTRLYKLSPAGIDKVTRDHSPVGEREDAGEISEVEAMRHARRNEVYRDLGSDRHEPGDGEFVDVYDIPFESDSALLLCSDGLTDLVESSAIATLARRYAGEPDAVVDALIDAANAAGGKDNVTAVYVEGDRFGAAQAPAATLPRPSTSNSEQYVRLALVVLLTVLIAVSLGRMPRPLVTDEDGLMLAEPAPGQLVVRRGESIADALRGAAAGTAVLVEPGEYRESVRLPSHVRLVSRVPGGAVLRLPANARETDAAAVADSVSGAALVGFRIVGDATTALGTGLLVRDSHLSVVDIDISGARNVAIDVGGASRVEVMASDVHDNPGAALAVRSGSSARVTHNVFMRNGGASPIILGEATAVDLAANMFYDLTPAAFRTLDEPARAALVRENWFFERRPHRSAAPAPPRSRP